MPPANEGWTPSESSDSATTEALVALRRDFDGLRASAQLRAVIEQAKGILVEREGLTLDEAFRKLRTMSQEHNVRLVEVAATLVGVAVPRSGPDPVLADEVLRDHLPTSTASSQQWQALQREEHVRAGVAEALLDSVVGNITEGDQSAELLRALLQPFNVAALSLYRADLEGSLHLVGQFGVPLDVAGPWKSIPISFDTPLTRAAADRRPHFWANQERRHAMYPAVQRASTGFEAAAAIPILADHELLGVVGLLWAEERAFGPSEQEAIVTSVQRLAPLLLRTPKNDDFSLDWLQALLSLHLDPWLVLDIAPSPTGKTRFVVRDASQILPDSADWLGYGLVELWPDLVQDGALDSLLTLASTGGFWTTTITTASPLPWGIPGARVRAIRIGSRIVLVWRPPLRTSP